ncbi:paraneoplastic antigen Ma6E-like [Patiria miniata]|uniref:Uncharacterized protein n=1 Tax=Patiria miniata TaxID=46514 RepID=A0A914B7K5_PATMI|nr:paraneoplastic antigen Ma6E-like [Patiria miniata]
MFSIRTVLFLSCAALAMAHPTFFQFRTPEGGGEQAEAEQPLMAGPAGPYPMNQVAGQQVASPSYDYGGGDAGAGGTTETESNESNDGDTGAAGSIGGGEIDGDTADNEAGEMEGGNAAENAAADSPDVVQAGGASGAASPNSLDGGPGLAKREAKSSAGQQAGIAVGVIATVGLAAGIGYFVYRKRRAAAYGARF